MFRFIRHNGESIVVQHAGEELLLTQQLRSYIKAGSLLIDHEVQRWHFNDFQAVRISRPVLKLIGKPLWAWSIRPY